MNDPLTLSGPHLSPVLSFPAVPWLLRSGVCLAWQLWKRHGSCFLSTGIVPGIVPTSWNSPHLIVIDSELSLSKSPYYMWESECSNSSSWHFTHGSWGDALWLKCPQNKREGMGLNPRTYLKSGHNDRSVIPVHLQQEGQKQETLPKQMCGYPGVHIGRQHKSGPDLKEGKRLGHSWGCPLAYTALSWQEHTPLTHAHESMPRGHPPQTNQVWETLWVSSRKPRVVLLLLPYLSGLLVVF